MPHINARNACIVITVLLIIGTIPDGVSRGQELDGEILLEHVRLLADDDLAGRETGEPGADSAAAYLEDQFMRLKLIPLFDGDYRQPFEVATTVSLGPNNTLSVHSPEGVYSLKVGRDWLPFSFSSSGPVSGRLIKSGHGLEAGDFTWKRPTSKVTALVDGGTPEGMRGHGGIDASFRRRAMLAREAGIDAIVIIVSELEEPVVGQRPTAVGIPAIQLVANEHTSPFLGQEYVRIHGRVDVSPVVVTGYNVGALVPGSSQSDAIIVVGAHYDHLGLGGPGSLDPDAHETHNGADDNASGTALMLELARHYSRPENRPDKSIAFVGFSAEEMGLLGSDFLVKNPPFDLENVVAMINFDMVGRLQDDKLQIFGTGTAAELNEILDRAVAGRGLTLSRVGDGYGPSDHTSFYARGVPVMHFFSGTHSQYHRPGDDWDLINSEGMARIGGLAIAVIDEIAARSQPLTYVEQQRPQAGRGGYGPYLGTIPDFGVVEGGGLRLSGVRAGSPAEKAGLSGGDVVVNFGGKEVNDIYDYTYALRDHAPGDSVQIRVRREGTLIDLTAILGQRN